MESNERTLMRTGVSGDWPDLLIISGICTVDKQRSEETLGDDRWGDSMENVPVGIVGCAEAVGDNNNNGPTRQV
jgi:hypothetical protein